MGNAHMAQAVVTERHQDPQDKIIAALIVVSLQG